MHLEEDEFIGPKQKSRFRVLRSEADGAGPVELEFVDDPGNPGPPMHWHPLADEQFTVLEGRLAMTIGGRAVVLEAGQSKLVPRGVPHTFRNADPERPVRFLSVHTPGRRFERLLGSMYDLDLDGRTDVKGVPGFLQLMALIDAHPDVTLIAGPPRFAQKALARVLGWIARLLGRGGVYRSRSRARAD